MTIINEVVADFKKLLEKLTPLEVDEKIKAINEIKLLLHKESPFKRQPVDCVLWVQSDKIKANDYNPNSVAPPEMELLRHSISEDGYTQPIVSWMKETEYEVVDGFHRHRVGTECEDVKEQVLNYLPIVVINDEQLDRGDRMSSTIRHNRARGKHKVEPMSEIVLELKRRNWSDKKISKNLGMDQDEILRLCQIGGLADMFSDKEFSEAWEADINNQPEVPVEIS
jgi:ParB-like chromosome segregation protein Spo0J